MKHQTKLFLSIICTSIASLSWAQDIKFNYITNRDTGHGLVLFEFLKEGVLVSPTGTCSCSFGFFYFRVNSKGSVDSIYHESTLSKDKVSMIINNIKATEGHWEIKKGSNSSQKYWFIYPYFDFGGQITKNRNCSDSEQLFQRNLISIANNLNMMESYIRRKGANMISPAQRGGPFLEL